MILKTQKKKKENIINPGLKSEIAATPFLFFFVFPSLRLLFSRDPLNLFIFLDIFALRDWEGDGKGVVSGGVCCALMIVRGDAVKEEVVTEIGQCWIGEEWSIWDIFMRRSTSAIGGAKWFCVRDFSFLEQVDLFPG